MRTFVTDTDNLGECPVWDERTGRLHWIDVTGKRISSCASDGSDVVRTSLDDIPGSFALRENGGYLIGFRRSLALIGPDGREERRERPAIVDFESERFNDGACDRRGRFWVGTMDRRLKQNIGGLYRVDSDMSVCRMAEGIGLSNGLAWSPDDRTLYHCDSAPAVIYAYDFDLDDGEVRNRRVFLQFDPSTARPDGCAMDSEGFLWVAALGSGAIHRYDPSGRLDRAIKTPVKRASSLCFGGPDWRRIYITTMGPHDGHGDDPLDGAVFVDDVDVAGLPRYRFAG